MPKILIRDKVERRKLKDIIPYEKNNKIHDEPGVEKIMHSIQKYGYTDQIEIDENNVILAGHGRLLALQKLGVKEATFKIIDGMPEKDKKSYRIEHNFTSEISEFNMENLNAEIEELGDSYLTDFKTCIFTETFEPMEAKQPSKIQNQEIDPDELLDDDKTIECPKCHLEFIPKGKRWNTDED